VAFTALFAQLTIVVIVFFMASKTIGGQFDLVFHGVFMAGMTIQTVMGTIQGVIGLIVVIEIPHQPIQGAVTQFALFGQFQFVHIVFFMAGITHDFLILVLTRRVTILASQQWMGTQQRELSDIVVKNNFLDPAFFLVTLSTIVTFLAVVHVIEFVAGGTFLGRFFFKQRALMTSIAWLFFMLAF
jgi:hypothetical protein